jgi:hypothetical protein
MQYNLKFDVTKTPPTADALNQQKQLLAAEQANLDLVHQRITLSLRVVSAFVLILMVVGAWSADWTRHGETIAALVFAGLFLWYFNSMTALISTLIGVGVLLAVFSVMPAAPTLMAMPSSLLTVPMSIAAAVVALVLFWIPVRFIDNHKARRFEVQKSLDALNKVETERSPEVVALCEQDSTLAVYQGQVAKQGRSLVNGEIDAMKEWIASAGERKNKADIELASERLKSPVEYRPVSEG